MKTTSLNTKVRENVPQKDSYNIREISTMVELTVLIRNAEKKLKPCPCCGDESIEKIDYWLKLAGDKPLHFFRITCPGGRGGQMSDVCGMQTMQWQASDNEFSIQQALDFISAKWNCRSEKKAS